jgi:molybdopterin/thiamine biosynthesis adenylyltransferase
MIVISGELIRSELNLTGSSPVRFTARPTEGVYSLLTEVNQYCPNVPGTIFVSRNIRHIKVTDIGEESDRVRVIIKKDALKTNNKNSIRGYVLDKDGWVRNEVVIVPVKEQLYSRINGLIETDKLKDKKVMIAGLGSGGSPIAVGLVKSGLGNIIMTDHDRLEVGNIMRHVLGLDDGIGRYKTLALADYLRNKNPFLNIVTYEIAVGWDNIEFVRGLVKEADLVICATGDGVSKRVLNRLCLQENKVMISAGAYTRACGGSILRVTPGESLCYQCLRQWFEGSKNGTFPNLESKDTAAYADQPVPIEPGLASDIEPISNLVVKLAIQTLLQGTKTTLRSLDDDLSMPLFLWYNRREKDTPAEKFESLGARINGMHVLRWYGVRISRHPHCVECGDFIGGLKKENNITEEEENEKLFECEHDQE